MVIGGTLAVAGAMNADWESAADAEYSAFEACRRAVEVVLKAPASAKWPNHTQASIEATGDDYTVVSHVDAQNGFGALVRSTFRCVVHHDTSAETWQTTALRFDGKVIY